VARPYRLRGPRIGSQRKRREPLQDALQRCAERKTVVRYIIGIDETGWGCIAGPLVACAVLVPEDWVPPVVLRDSKELSEKRAGELSWKLRTNSCVRYWAAVVQPETIDRLGPAEALRFAHSSVEEQASLAAHKTPFAQARVITDGTTAVPSKWPTEAMVKADGIVPAVMAASIIGKAHRDSIMRRLMEPDLYKLASNKGYPTPEHKRLLLKYGASLHHRRSYKPVQEALKEAEK
jgi:ribonuclease HII